MLPLELTGVLGWAERVIGAAGEWGVGLLVLLETVFPPLPSEVILPLAGFLTASGSISLPLVVVTATLGAWAGALLLYGLGARLGQERSIRLLAKLPLVDASDFERASSWFRRHGRSSVFFGRLIPGVRSLISLPAGAERMPLTTFSLFTLAGSGLWNGVLIGLGAALGSRYAQVEQYSRFLNYAVWAAVVALVGWLVVRSVRRRRAAAREDRDPRASGQVPAGEPSAPGSRTPG
jgi:membrane protein DedA with SNARE-associated domain